ncbi:hypothetical protein B0H13DRAFT_1850801 [Mycena leptocephala]|nr:hypothetical protein B0H13DRAFT_1850801 [Mycena leptocephala]
MISRIGQFMSAGRPRAAAETKTVLRYQFKLASVVGGMAGFKRNKTDTGVKDTFRVPFSTESSLFQLNGSEKMRINVSNVDFDPHQDTPVEILHFILVGFVKYFWRDAVARVKKSDKEILISCLYRLIIFGDNQSVDLGTGLPAGREQRHTVKGNVKPEQKDEKLMLINLLATLDAGCRRGHRGRVTGQGHGGIESKHARFKDWVQISSQGRIYWSRAHHGIHKPGFELDLFA